jgi:1-acyl-sn-glycerol-3-phosphate acyltransferase
MKNFFYRFTAAIIRTILRLNGGYEVRGKENIPADGGVLVAANHISYLDPPFLGAVMPRRATFMARKGLFDIPVLSWMIRNTAFPVDRERTRPSTIKETVRRLKNGELIVIFPEGRRNETGDIAEGKRGVGMIVSLSKAPVVPALIVGTDMALKVDAKWLSRARVTVIFGEPIYYNAVTSRDEGRSSHEVYEEISKKIMATIKEMKSRYGY